MYFTFFYLLNIPFVFAMDNDRDHFGVNYKAVSFFVQAHPDDWQLFQGHSAWNDLNQVYPEEGDQILRNKVVFIYTTAGDAGEEGNFWELRERGALASVKIALADNGEYPPITLQEFNNHQIAKYSIRNTESYFLRLPDGSMHGEGFPHTGNRSLKKLHDYNSPMNSLGEHVETYPTWKNFWKTLQNIIETATPMHLRNQDQHPWINVADFDDRENPGDHYDHKETSNALREFYAGKYGRALYKTYSSRDLPTDLPPDDIAHKHTMYQAYLEIAGGQNHNHDGWIEKGNIRHIYHQEQMQQ